MSLRRVIASLFVLVPIVFGACGTGSSGNTGKIIFMHLAGIDEFDVKSRATKPLIKRDDPNTFLLDPSVSPDNTLIAYVSQPPPRVVSGRPDRGSDLWVAKRDGSNPHAVFTHVTPNQLVSSPQWEDSTHLLAVVQEITQQNGTTNVIYNLERIEVATGVRAVVLNDVLAFGLSPNRKRVVYAHLAHPSGETLEAVDLAGGTPITLIDLSQNLQPFNSPRFSREGTAIAFASAEQTGARADATYVMAPRFGSPTRATNDGLPEDIWIVPAAGGTARRVADVKEDLPALTWSGDDRHIFVLGASALYDVALGSGAVDPIGPGSFHGQLTWTP